MRGNKLGVDDIDGRPLYQYRVSLSSSGLHDLNSIDIWEAVLENPKSRDDQLIKFLAPVAAARFASKYEDGIPSWEHCGEAVTNLRNKNFARFSYLLERSLELYHISPLKLQNGDTRWLETIIGQAGLPAGMLKPGKVIRSILDKLIAHLAGGQEGLEAQAVTLINEAVSENKLRTAYRDAGHLPGLCEDLVRSIFSLTADAGWNGEELDAIWAIPGWQERLPFRVDIQAAKDIVSQLLKVAIKAASGGDTGIVRVLRLSGGAWKMKTRALVSPDGIDLAPLGLDQPPPAAAVFYTVNGQPVEEAFRIRQKDEARYRLSRGPNELTVDEGARGVTIGLALCHQGRYLAIPAAGGDALDEGSVWVFEPRNGEYFFRAPAPVRLRSTELLVAIEEGARVTGAAQQLSGAYLSSTGLSKRRELWKVSGYVRIERENEDPTWIEAGFEGAQSHLDFKGRCPANFQVEGYASVYIGNPEPRRVGGLTGRMQWRRQGETNWHEWKGRAEPGLLAFRLVDEAMEVIAERRRVLIFPEGFRSDVTSRGISLRFPVGIRLQGAQGDAENHVVPFSQASTQRVELRVGDTNVKLIFTKPAVGAFIDLLTQEQFTHGRKVINSWTIDHLCAISGQQNQLLEVSRCNERNAYPIPLGDGGRLNLFSLRSFLRALAYKPRLKRHSVLLEFRNAAALQLDDTASRIRCTGSTLVVNDATSDMELELRSMTVTQSGSHEVIALERQGNDVWIIPELEGRDPLYLAVDKSRQAFPCLVVGKASFVQENEPFLTAVCLKDADERESTLVDLYTGIVTAPHESKSIRVLQTLLCWMVDFQMFLEWLDPFLVMASRPSLAMKMLVLAEVQEQHEAASALREALGNVPFFWHRVTPRVLSELMDWGIQQFGHNHLLPMLAMLEKVEMTRRLSRLPSAVNDQAIKDWEEAIANFRWVTPNDRRQRTRSMAEFTQSSLWGNPLLQSGKRAALMPRVKSLSGQVDLSDTYYFAPQELAIAHALGVELTDPHTADFIYARYVIDPARFDAAYAAAICILEG